MTVPGAISPTYWDDLAQTWSQRDPSWRAVTDAVQSALIRRLLPVTGGSVLKTDLFDEAVGTGLYPLLAERFTSVSGIDISAAAVQLARRRWPSLNADPADVRDLPHREASFDAVVSNSTLDHFEAAADIGRSLREIYRVLRPGGSLLITMDNPVNPVVAVRNAMPERARAATGLVPYQVGPTCGPGEMRTLLKDAGFEVAASTSMLHCPRLLAIWMGRLLDRMGADSLQRPYIAACSAFEGLRFLPTQYITGYFVAALAHKPSTRKPKSHQ